MSENKAPVRMWRDCGEIPSSIIWMSLLLPHSASVGKNGATNARDVMKEREKGREHKQSKCRSTAKRPAPSVLDLVAVAKLAMYGLNEQEIRLKLELPNRLSAKDTTLLSAAIQEGRLRGSAEVKEAQYDAACSGQVSAQGRVLELLRGGDEEDELEVVRKIYGSRNDAG